MATIGLVGEIFNGFNGEHIIIHLIFTVCFISELLVQNEDTVDIFKYYYPICIGFIGVLFIFHTNPLYIVYMYHMISGVLLILISICMTSIVYNHNKNNLGVDILAILTSINGCWWISMSRWFFEKREEIHDHHITHYLITEFGKIFISVIFLYMLIKVISKYRKNQDVN